MSFSPVPGSMSPAAWMQVLERIEQALDGAIATTSEREQMLPAEMPSVDRATVWQSLVQRLEERLASLRARVDQAAQGAAEVDALLGANAEGLRLWREKAALLSRSPIS